MQLNLQNDLSASLTPGSSKEEGPQNRRFTGKESAKSPSARFLAGYPVGFLLERELHCRKR
jgi:hypothetical protein